MNFDIGTEINLEKLIETRLLVQANSGGGKSYVLRKILEETNGKVQQIVFDLEGEFSSLREKYDFVVFGNEGDYPIHIKYAYKIIHTLLEHNVSAIIDLYELKHPERILFVKRALESMINASKKLWHPCLVVIDEAHIFAPEKGKAESLSAVIDLCTRGRKRGYCSVLATQRLSKLHKDAAAECNNKLIGRTGLDVDMKRAADELGFTSKLQMLDLRNLSAGAFYAFGPAINLKVEEVNISEVKTTHPKTGSRLMTVPPASNKIKGILSQFKDLPQEAEKELLTIQDLKKEVKELRSKLTIANKGQKPIVDQTAIIELKKENSYLQKRLTDNDKLWERRLLTYKNLITKFRTMLVSFEMIDEPMKEAFFNDDKTKLSKSNFADKVTIIKGNPENTYSKPQSVIYHSKPIADSETKIGKCERSILTVLAQRNAPSNKSQLGILTGYSSKSGGFNNALGKLRSSGLINGFGDNIQITEEGLFNLGEYDPLPTGNELRDYWYRTLHKAESKILQALVNAYPETLNKEQIGEITGYSHNSGGFNNALGKLRTLELIKGYRDIIASENLFD